MSQMPHMGQQQQLEVYRDPNQPLPTFYANIVQTQLFEEEVYLDFCIRSAEKPMMRADLQCRVITSVNHLRRLVEGWTGVLAQLDEIMRQRGQQQRLMTGGGGADAGEADDVVEQIAREMGGDAGKKGKKR